MGDKYTGDYHFKYLLFLQLFYWSFLDLFLLIRVCVLCLWSSILVSQIRMLNTTVETNLKKRVAFKNGNNEDI